VVEAAGAEQELAYRVIEEVIPMLLKLDREKSPAENSTLLLRRAYAVLGQEDPFRAAKAESNRMALAWLPHLERMVAEAPDPLVAALKVSVAGNIIDMGILPGRALNPDFEELEGISFARFDYQELREALSRAKRVLVIGDNSGEIVLDRLLLEELSRGDRRVAYAVKAGPILNDATRADAREAGLEELAEVVDTGSDYLGVIEGYCSRDFIRIVEDSELIIAKGQANYETLEGHPLAGEKTFFLLRAKCPVVAAHLGVPPMAAVLVRNQPRY
jgi:uncharacterized protein with ATP-grasp and redox domains